MYKRNCASSWLFIRIRVRICDYGLGNILKVVGPNMGITQPPSQCLLWLKGSLAEAHDSHACNARTRMSGVTPPLYVTPS
jgi:hypothetical protein